MDGERRDLQSNIENISKNIAIKEKEIEIIKERIKLSNKLLEKRLRTMYKKGSVGYIEVLVDSKDVADFMTRVDMIQKIIDSDVSILEKLKSDRKEYENTQLKLLEEKNAYASLIKSVESKKNEVAVASRAKETYVRSLSRTIQDLKAQEKAFDEASKSLEEKIRQEQLKTKYAGGIMSWPSPGYYTITSPYGGRVHPVYGYWSMHTGVDIRVPMNSRIVATNSGQVREAGWHGAYGNIVVIDHGGGISTVYAHNTSLLVSEGQKVAKDQQISYSGTTGLSTGPHLHFEVRENGAHVNPMNYLQ